ncbi:hypothetical protein OS175_07210 [Marinicella sp. S1101]|uniref:hypothetical protein n=1 Tax=Marinicella marina TaxID=2996016 RepID=UPI002260F1FB|nr:hypothetical protein [Marinicella marina]MCX7553662.1 hypothetical protein [Marinicella marina]MDJ1140286.1 hypothetical protein [Marinicella marina]
MKMYHPVKKICMALLIAMSQQSIAQWNIEINESEGASRELPLVLPFTYSTTQCQFDFDVIDTSVVDLIVDGTATCSNDHYLVIDRYKYPVSKQMMVTFGTNFIDFSDGVNLGVCTTLSGEDINTDAPFLYVGMTVFQLDVTFPHEVKKVGNEVHLITETSNHDIICEGAELAELIFKGGFE